MTILLIFIIGLCIGSFLNVVIDRMPRNESIVKGRSYCESCKKTLQWFDLIPIFSFLFLHGKCRYCQKKIGNHYILVEFTTSLFFVITFLFVQSQYPASSLVAWIHVLYYLFIISSLLAIFFIDLKFGIIPDKIVYPSIVVTLLYVFFYTQPPFAFLSAAGAFLFFLIIAVATRGKGMGFGDVKFAIFMGLFLGFPKIIVAIYLAVLTGAIVSIILVIRKKKKFIGGTIAFGPFLVLGTLISLFWGEAIIKIAGVYLFGFPQ